MRVNVLFILKSSGGLVNTIKIYIGVIQPCKLSYIYLSLLNFIYPVRAIKNFKINNLWAIRPLQTDLS